MSRSSSRVVKFDLDMKIASFASQVMKETVLALTLEQDPAHDGEQRESLSRSCAMPHLATS